MAFPKTPGSSTGNRISAARYSAILRGLGHRVASLRKANRPDLLVALHAFKSAETVAAFRWLYPDKPIVLVLTGTDVYGKIRSSPAASAATRLVVLQPMALNELDDAQREKARVIFQSAKKTAKRKPPREDVFQVCVVSHLRGVKDPFRASFASELLPKSSRVKILHAGAPLQEGMAEKARLEAVRNPRYHWLGSVSPGKARALIARTRLLVLSSEAEGGANAIAEAVVDGTPVLASRIPGSVGMLGEHYPGYFPVHGSRALAGLLSRAESDAAFYAGLVEACAQRAPLFDPARERETWRKLIEEIC